MNNITQIKVNKQKLIQILTDSFREQMEGLVVSEIKYGNYSDVVTLNLVQAVEFVYPTEEKELNDKTKA